MRAVNLTHLPFAIANRQTAGEVAGDATIKAFVAPPAADAAKRPDPARRFLFAWGPRHSGVFPTLTTHEWRASEAPEGAPPALLLKSTFVAGLAGLGRPLNEFIVNAWRNGAGAEERCQRLALHFIEGAWV